MNILSLFDGMSCAQIALERSGIEVHNYISSEIDKWAIKVTKHNYPNTIQVGDVCNLSYRNGKLYCGDKVVFTGKIDLLIGGSPCQSFSGLFHIQKNINESVLSGKSALYYQWLRLFYEVNPKYWLLENVVMPIEYQNMITEDLGELPIMINSRYFSAQNRKRLYWTNIKVASYSDRNILLTDILLSEEEVSETPSLWHSTKAVDMMNRETKDGRDHWDFQHHSDTQNDKSSCVLATIYKVVPQNVLIDRRTASCDYYDCDFQATDVCKECISYDCYQSKYNPTPIIRRFSIKEVERLQTIPEDYTKAPRVSDTQRYKMLGNAFTVDVISHILSSIK